MSTIVNILSSNPLNIHIVGYMFGRLSNVFLSSGNIAFPSLTAVNNFTYRHRVSSICPAFTGYNYPSQYFAVQNNNTIIIASSGFIGFGSGSIDIILYNQAGYTKLSDYGYSITINPQSNNNAMYMNTIGNDALLTLGGDYIVTIQ